MGTSRSLPANRKCGSSIHLGGLFGHVNKTISIKQFENKSRPITIEARCSVEFSVEQSDINRR